MRSLSLMNAIRSALASGYSTATAAIDALVSVTITAASAVITALTATTAAITTLTATTINGISAADNKTRARADALANLAGQASTGIHASVLATAANAFPGPFTNPATPRTVLAQFTALWDGGNILLTGTDQFDTVITDTLVSPGVPGGFVASTKIFKTITAASKTAIGVAAVGVTLGPGIKIGFLHHLDASVASSPVLVMNVVDGVIDTIASIDMTYHGWTPGSTQPNGGHEFLLIYPGAD